MSYSQPLSLSPAFPGVFAYLPSLSWGTWMILPCQDLWSGWAVPNSCEKGKVQISTKVSPADLRMSYLGWKNLRDAVIAIMNEIFRITFPVFCGPHESRLASLRACFSTSWDWFKLSLYLLVDIIELKPAEHLNLSSTVAAAFCKMLFIKYCSIQQVSHCL